MTSPSATAPSGPIEDTIQLFAIARDALKLWPPFYVTSILGWPNTWYPSDSSFSEYRILSPWHLWRSLHFLATVTVPAAPHRPPSLGPPAVKRFFWRPTTILQRPDHNGSYTTYPEEAWIFIALHPAGHGDARTDSLDRELRQRTRHRRAAGHAGAARPRPRRAYRRPALHEDRRLGPLPQCPLPGRHRTPTAAWPPARRHRYVRPVRPVGPRPVSGRCGSSSVHLHQRWGARVVTGNTKAGAENCAGL